MSEPVELDLRGAKIEDEELMVFHSEEQADDALEMRLNLIDSFNEWENEAPSQG